MTDAYAFVVSEERGEITIAVGGVLSKPLTDNQVRSICNHYFSFEGKKESNFMSRLREEIQHKWPGGNTNE